MVNVKSIITLVLCCATVSTVSAADLKVNFSGLSSAKGNIMVAVYNSEASYKAKEPVYKAKIPANGPLMALFKDMSAGTYAVAAYQDENENGKLDTNLVGMPVEPYGFSNNRVAHFGPPPYKDILFSVAADPVSLTISLE